jgi:nucleoside-triphosphate--adenylate kinase
MYSGNLVPDDLTNSLILQELKKMNHKSWILDGYPRTLNQAKLLDELLGPSEPLNLVINLNIHSHVILNRISQRYIHPPR